MGNGKRRLERHFRASWGHRPQAAFLQIRLTFARHLIETTDKSVESWPLSAAFASVHLSRMFRQRFASTPRRNRGSRHRCLRLLNRPNSPQCRSNAALLTQVSCAASHNVAMMPQHGRLRLAMIPVFVSGVAGKGPERPQNRKPPMATIDPRQCMTSLVAGAGQAWSWRRQCRPSTWASAAKSNSASDAL